METKTKRNCRVQKLYDMLMGEGKHGHYEAMFHIVRIEVEVEREACAQTCDRLAEMMEGGAGEIEPGGRLRQAAREMRSRSPNQPI